MVELTIPNEWAKVNISDIADVDLGKTPKKADYLSIGDYKVVKFRDVDYSGIDWSNDKDGFVGERSVYNLRELKLHDVLITASAHSSEHIGKKICFVAKLPKDYKKIYFCGELLGISSKNGFLSPKFCFYYFLSHTGYKEIQSHVKGVHLTSGQARNMSIPFTPPLEQNRIIEIVEELFSDLDNAIENLKKAQEQLKVYRQAIFWKGFEGGFTGGLKGWRTCKISDICLLIDGDRGKNYPNKNELFDKEYCLFLSAKNVRPNGFEFNNNIFISKEKHEKLRSGTLQRGDVVITTRGTIGNVALYDESVPFPVVRLNSGMLILRLKSDALIRGYLASFLRSPLFTWQIRKNKSGTAQPQLPANVLKEFEIKIPPIDVQSLIVQETEARLSICDQAESTIEENLQKAEALRQSILKHAFMGKLTESWRKKHTDFISGRNSVETLLKKIKAEKEALRIKPKGRNKND